MSFRRSLDGAEKCALRVLRRDEVTEDEYFIARVVKRRTSSDRARRAFEPVARAMPTPTHVRASVGTNHTVCGTREADVRVIFMFYVARWVGFFHRS